MSRERCEAVPDVGSVVYIAQGRFRNAPEEKYINRPFNTYPPRSTLFPSLNARLHSRTPWPGRPTTTTHHGLRPPRPPGSSGNPARHVSTNRAKEGTRLTGVPNPVTGSHPTSAGNPDVLHPTALPTVTSLKAAYPPAYSQGFRKPRGGRPWAMRASLTREMTEAVVGVEALVPSCSRMEPSQTVTKRVPWALTSG